MNPNIQQVIKELELKPHPEGGFYAETYRSNSSTAIYFLILPDSFSAIHRLEQDELWHFYAGSPVTIVELGKGGSKKIVVGNNIEKGEAPQYSVKAGTWFGAYLEEGDFALVGCTVAPPFDFKGFELGKREGLLKEFPKSKEEILKLTR